MRVVAQRVSRAAVRVRGTVVGEIGNGLMVLVGFTHDDTSREVGWMTEKLLGLRIFADDDGKMNRAVADIGGSILVVSQFTLYGDGRKGRRPSFVDAARPEGAIPLYQEFLLALAKGGVHVAAGEFGADMQVELVNDGPVTLLLERSAAEAG
jgi:D-aminoacyl-tRNA deacylase